MYALALIPIAILGGIILWYILKSQAQERSDYLRAINLATTEGTRERQEYRELIASLTEKIQHPETPHPVAPVQGPAVGPPPQPDEVDLVGTIQPEPQEKE
jgi:hypothetical protein